MVKVVWFKAAIACMYGENYQKKERKRLRPRKLSKSKGKCRENHQPPVSIRMRRIYSICSVWGRKPLEYRQQRTATSGGPRVNTG